MKKETKDIIQYGSAIWMIFLGSSLSIAGFIISKGEIHDSVLWLFAQCLLYAGAVFGISVYVTDRFNRIEKRLFNNKKESDNETNK